MSGIWGDGAPMPGQGRHLPGAMNPNPLTLAAAAYQSGPAASDNSQRSEPSHPSDGIPSRVSRRLSRIQQFEGPRGHATRASVLAKYVSYFLLVAIASAVTQVATVGVPYASSGGWVMLLCVTVTVVIGAVATMFYANLRTELVEKTRHYVFGYILPSGTLIAIFLRVSQNWFGPDTFGATLSAALPVVFLASVVLPVLVFVKEVTGLRTLYRSRLDDQEAVALWTRQDGLLR